MRALAAISLFVVTSLFTFAEAAHGQCVGTYSNLKFNKESGDLHGLEIAITPVDGGFGISIQMAEDGINELHYSKIKKNDGNIQFSIQLDSGNSVTFSLQCSPKKCWGDYIWGEERINFTLPKSVGYWNKK